jgi:putative addiction module killer protein
MALQIRYFQSDKFGQPFIEWLQSLSDRQARARIEARIARVAVGNFGDVASVGEGVMELRINWGPGYRVYFSQLGDTIVLLLCGGDKRTQRRDIERAKAYFQDYKARSAKTPRGA